MEVRFALLEHGVECLHVVVGKVAKGLEHALFGSPSFGVDLMYKGIKSTPNDEGNHEQ